MNRKAIWYHLLADAVYPMRVASDKKSIFIEARQPFY